jgi:hypothetical protein
MKSKYVSLWEHHLCYQTVINIGLSSAESLGQCSSIVLNQATEGHIWPKLCLSPVFTWWSFSSICLSNLNQISPSLIPPNFTEVSKRFCNGNKFIDRWQFKIILAQFHLEYKPHSWDLYCHISGFKQFHFSVHASPLWP